MTRQELIEYYTDLLVIQYRAKPKARAHVAALIDSGLILDLIRDVQNGYDIDTAIGVQLDNLAKIQGTYRSYNQGQPISDSDLRSITKLKQIQNSSNYSLKSLDEIFTELFPDKALLLDNENMTGDYIFAESERPAVTFAKLQGAIPKPMAVNMSISYVRDTTKIFGYDGYYKPPPNFVVGFGTYQDDTEGEMLTYGEDI